MDTIIERNNVVFSETSPVSSTSAVSWAAVFAGALAAAALSLVLFILGIGLGFGALSPWSNEGIGASAFGLSTILWITFTSLVASGLGGYLAGRMRTRWLGTPQDEVYFRDTAHGFLAWGLATLLTAALFTTMTASVVGTGLQATASVAGGITEAASAATGAFSVSAFAGGEEDENNGMTTGTIGYHLDALFRSTGEAVNQGNTRPAPDTNGITQQEQQQAADIASTEEGAAALTPDQQAAVSAGGAAPETTPAPQAASASERQPVTSPALGEVGRIFARALRDDELPQEDLTYVGRLVSERTGLSPMEAEARVTAMYQGMQDDLRDFEIRARETADEVRATSAKIALWFFLALLIGAFVSSLSATFGGKLRDQ